MPLVGQLFIVCIVAVVVAVVVVLVLKAVGLDENASLIAAISASIASSTAMVQLQAGAKKEAVKE